MQANYYHMHHILFQDDINFWREKIQQASPHPCLELGCGTGRVFQSLIESNSVMDSQIILGIDNDPKMLAVAKKIIEGYSQFKLCEADILKMDFDSTFELIYFPCNTFSTFSTKEQNTLLLRVKAILSPTGKFIISQPNPTVFKSFPNSIEPEIEVILQNNQSENAVTVSSEWQCDNDFFYIQWHYDEMFPNGKIKRTTLRTKHYLTKTQSILNLFKKNGFEINHLYGDFDQSSYTNNSDNLIIEASL